MMPIFFSLPGGEGLTLQCSAALGAPIGEADLRRFPDGEWYVRVRSPIEGRTVVVVGSLDQSNEKFLGALLLAATLRDLGASRIGFVVPYLSYLRQDSRFKAGEGITSRYVARVISQHFDWLVTVDPHLHRYASLSEVYSIPSAVMPAAPLLAAWIGERVCSPVLVGPDLESEHWVRKAAAQIDAPYVLVSKTRRGDRDVTLILPDMDQWRGRNPVVVDDVIATGYTMIGAVERLREKGFCDITCAAVHPVFAGSAYADLLCAGAEHIVTSNTIEHSSNKIDVGPLLVEGIARFL